MKENKKITATYNNKRKTLSPYGLVYGEKIYLVAREERKGPSPYNYLLHKFSDLCIKEENFERGDFNLNEFSKKSFGIYQGESYDVKLLFSKEAASNVLNYSFHPTQKIKENLDGTISLQFKASGEYEILWHLFKWGKSVQIVAPTSLKEKYINMLKEMLENSLTTSNS